MNAKRKWQLARIRHHIPSSPSPHFSPVRGCVATTADRVVIPNECEGAKTDFSLWSKQGFLPAVEMTEGPTGTMFHPRPLPHEDVVERETSGGLHPDRSSASACCGQQLLSSN